MLCDLAALTNNIYCDSQNGVLVNRFPVMMMPIGWREFPTIFWYDYIQKLTLENSIESDELDGMPIGMPSIFVFLVPKLIIDYVMKIKQCILTDHYLPFIINWNFAAFSHCYWNAEAVAPLVVCAVLISYFSVSCHFLGTLFSSCTDSLAIHMKLPLIFAMNTMCLFWCIAYLYIFFLALSSMCVHLNKGTITYLCFFVHISTCRVSTNKWWSFYYGKVYISYPCFYLCLLWSVRKHWMKLSSSEYEIIGNIFCKWCRIVFVSTFKQYRRKISVSFKQNLDCYTCLYGSVW